MMTIDSPTATFSLVPRGPFSLRLAAGHAFGPRLDAQDSDRWAWPFASTASAVWLGSRWSRHPTAR